MGVSRPVPFRGGCRLPAGGPARGGRSVRFHVRPEPAGDARRGAPGRRHRRALASVRRVGAGAGQGLRHVLGITACPADRARLPARGHRHDHGPRACAAPSAQDGVGQPLPAPGRPRLGGGRRQRFRLPDGQRCIRGDRQRARRRLGDRLPDDRAGAPLAGHRYGEGQSRRADRAVAACASMGCCGGGGGHRDRARREKTRSSTGSKPCWRDASDCCWSGARSCRTGIPCPCWSTASARRSSSSAATACWTRSSPMPRSASFEWGPTCGSST